ncbi:hypothetical protein ACFO0S_09655 [Chryseomicrobium palamuruense]|uniref:Phage protein n=1 Tax=Chryseomicrobium palamuruense TaxID=682973 RepID=A0ABV8UVF8_9BACL
MIVRATLERTYDGVCTVIEYQSYKKPNKSTGQSEVPVLNNQPCRLSFTTVKNNEQMGNSAKVQQVVKLFISPDVRIKPGSKITVTQSGVTNEYQSSGEPAMYDTHQEIVLELFKGWA